MRRSDREAHTEAPPLTKESFSEGFLSMGTRQIESFADELDLAKKILDNPEEDWARKCERLQTVRYLIVRAEGISIHTIIPQICAIASSLEKAVRDLRSSVVKEATLTISFLCDFYNEDMAPLGELSLPAAFSQLAVSTKVVAEHAMMLAQYIVESVQTKQIFKIVESYMTSKDKNQRKAAVFLVEKMLTTWDSQLQNELLQRMMSVILLAMYDADSNTRVEARKAYETLKVLYPVPAEVLFSLLDPAKQKLVSNGGSSKTNLNEEKENVPVRSGFSSLGAKSGASFLAKRSTSATSEKTVDTSPGGSKFTRPTMVRTTSSLQSSIPIAPAKPRSRPSAPSAMQRGKSNLGSDSFWSSIPEGEAKKLEKTMMKAREVLYKSTDEEDDDLLLPKRDDTEDFKARLVMALREINRSSSALKRAGIDILLDLIKSTAVISPEDVLKIANLLIRTSAELTYTGIVITLGQIFDKYSKQLSTWLVPTLLQLITITESPDVQRKNQAVGILRCVAHDFDVEVQFKALGEIVTSRVLPMKTSLRLPYLNHLLNVLEVKVTEENCVILKAPEAKKVILKILEWVMLDQKLEPVAEKIIRFMHTLNRGVFIEVVKDVDQKFHYFITRCLPNPHEKIFENSPRNSPKNSPQAIPKPRKSGPFMMSPLVNALDDISSPKVKPKKESKKDPKKESKKAPKTDPEDELAEQIKRIIMLGDDQKENIKALKFQTNNQKVRFMVKLLGGPGDHFHIKSLQHLQDVFANGDFELWDECFPTIRNAVIMYLTPCREACDELKYRAIRLVSKICHVRATALFDSAPQLVELMLNVMFSTASQQVKHSSVDCLKVLATHIPIVKMSEIVRKELEVKNNLRKIFVLDMISKMYEMNEAYELDDTVASIAPAVLNIYLNSEPDGPKKAACIVLNTMRTRMGAVMLPYLATMSRVKMEVLDCFAARDKAT